MDASVASRVIHGRTARRLCNRFCIGRIVRHENDSLDRFLVCLAPALHERLDVSGRHQPDIMPKGPISGGSGQEVAPSVHRLFATGRIGISDKKVDTALHQDLVQWLQARLSD